MPQVWCIFKGGVYLKVDEIKSFINYSVDIFPIKLTELTSFLLILIMLGRRCIFRGSTCWLLSPKCKGCTWSGEMLIWVNTLPLIKQVLSSYTCRCVVVQFFRGLNFVLLCFVFLWFVMVCSLLHFWPSVRSRWPNANCCSFLSISNHLVQTSLVNKEFFIDSKENVSLGVGGQPYCTVHVGPLQYWGDVNHTVEYNTLLITA